MKARDAIHLVNALRESAESLELEFARAGTVLRKDDGEFELSETLRGALVELACSLGVELGLELKDPH